MGALATLDLVVLAAYLLVVDGQVDSAAATPPWTDREPAQWFAAAATADSVDDNLLPVMQRIAAKEQAWYSRSVDLH